MKNETYQRLRILRKLGAAIGALLKAAAMSTTPCVEPDTEAERQAFVEKIHAEICGRIWLAQLSARALAPELAGPLMHLLYATSSGIDSRGTRAEIEAVYCELTDTGRKRISEAIADLDALRRQALKRT